LTVPHEWRQQVLKFLHPQHPILLNAILLNRETFSPDVAFS
jgi:hypothetical protein